MGGGISWIGDCAGDATPACKSGDPEPKTHRGCHPGLQMKGRAWQDGFFDHLLRNGESYGEKWNYVRMNPVRAGLVAHPEDWPYAGEIEKLSW